MAGPGARPEVGRPDFWEGLYQQGRCGWDLGQAAPPFLDLLLSEAAPAPGRLLALGCGRGHDALLFARFGFTVTGVDFAPSAVAAARQAARSAGLAAEFVEADLFELGVRWPAAFDYVLEHTCFCAIDPPRRPDYLRVVQTVLRPGGELIGLFEIDGRPGGPPFSTSGAELRALFGSHFAIVELEMAANAVAHRRGRQLFGRFRRRPGGRVEGIVGEAPGRT